MSWAMAQAEVLWAAASLMLLGAAVGACVRCQRWASKREKQQSEWRRQFENPQSFEVIRSRSMLATTRRLEQNKEWEHSPVTRKTNEELNTTCRIGSEGRADSRYQNFLKEEQLHEEATYVDPISWDYYNCVNPVSPHEKEEDSYSYQNVIVGACLSSNSATDDMGDYENSTAIHIWTLQQATANIENPDEEPDYVNTNPASGLASLPKQSTSQNLKKPFVKL